MANINNFPMLLVIEVLHMNSLSSFSGLLMSITLPCFHEGKFIGVAGTDINMDDLLSDITFFNQGQSTYAFMISNSGRTLIHPLLPAPTDAYGDPVFLDIRTLEPETEFEEVFYSIKRYVYVLNRSLQIHFLVALIDQSIFCHSAFRRICPCQVIRNERLESKKCILIVGMRHSSHLGS